jgi:ABC-type transport system substrate-binding protein
VVLPEAEKKKADPRFAFLQRKEIPPGTLALRWIARRSRRPCSWASRAGVGPITPGNREWFTPNLPRYPYDPAKAKSLLASIGLEDRNGNGTVEDARGTEARLR